MRRRAVNSTDATPVAKSLRCALRASNNCPTKRRRSVPMASSRAARPAPACRVVIQLNSRCGWRAQTFRFAVDQQARHPRAPPDSRSTAWTASAEPVRPRSSWLRRCNAIALSDTHGFYRRRQRTTVGPRRNATHRWRAVCGKCYVAPRACRSMMSLAALILYLRRCSAF